MEGQTSLVHRTNIGRGESLKWYLSNLKSKLRRFENEQFGRRYMVTYMVFLCVSIRESEYRTRNEYLNKGPVNKLDRAILSDYRLCI